MSKKALANSYLSSFCLELSMLLHSGIVPGEALLMLLDDERDVEGKAVLQRLIDLTKPGEPLSPAFRESGFFPDYMVNMMDFGERTGRLAETMEALSVYYNRQDRLAISLRSALMYPSLLFIMMVGAVLILIVQVLPIFNDVFGMMGTQMSPLASRLMMFGNWLSGASAVIAAVVCAVGVVAFAAWAVPGIRGGISSWFKNTWGGSGLFAKIATSRFTAAMALAIKSGLAIEDAVGLASAISGGAKDIDLRNKNCLEMLKQGKSISEAMSAAGILSARDTRMLSIGSRSGRTDNAIEEIAKRSDENVQDDISRLVGKIEPTLVIITSVMVGVVLFSVMLPLIGIMTSIG